MAENNQPLVSVIIPNYNHTRFLPDAIQSVLAQRYPHYEIIIVDDGSTDDSREVVAQFGDKLYYIWQNNQGLAGARNTGIRAAGGELVSLLDADDIWAPDYLEQMVALAEENPDAIVFYCMAQCMDVDRRDLPQFVGGPPVETELLYQKLLRANFIIPSTVTFRRKTIVDVGYFDSDLRSCEDWDLWLRLLRMGKGKIVGSSKSLVHYRVHGSSLSTDVDGMHRATKKVIEKHFGLEDGRPESWTSEKRRAYGGSYRYQVITFIQRQNNWEVCVPLLKKALQIDASLALDLDFFYELTLGTQQVGHRGVSTVDGFDKNADHLEKLLRKTFSALDNHSLRKKTFGTAYYALGLASYNIGTRSACRRYLRGAVLSRPALILNLKLIKTYFRSFLSRKTVRNLKRWLGSLS